MLPTFIVAGAARAGTTTTWNYLRAHPEVCMAQIKEPMFFTQIRPNGSDPKAPLHVGRYDKGLGWYTSMFQGCQRTKARGESSTIYMVAEDAPYLIQRHIPEAQIIFILRDPVQRLYSNYLQEQKLGWALPEFSTMVDQRHPSFERYLYASSYHLHLERYLRLFSRHQLSVFLFEDLERRPQQFIREIYQAIGVDPDFRPPDLGQRYNEARIPKAVWFQRFLSVGTKIGMGMNMSTRLYTRLAKIRQRLVYANSVPTIPPPLSSKLRKKLVQELMAAIEYVETYRNCELPIWRES